MRIKILQVINSFAFAGAELLAKQIAKKLDQNSFDVSVCSVAALQRDDEQKLKRILEEEGIPSFSIARRANTRRFSGIMNLRKIINAEKIDIVHTHCTSPDFYGLVASHLAGVQRTARTLHTAGLWMLGEDYRYVREKIFATLCKKNIAISRESKEWLEKELRIKDSKMVFIPNGIDCGSLKDLQVDTEFLMSDLGIKKSDKILCSVGRVTKQKRHDRLIRAIPRVLDSYPDLKVFIIGDDISDREWSKNLKDEVSKLRLQDVVIFTGVRSDVHAILKIAHLFLFPSDWETAPLALLEAMFLGLPVISTNVFGVREVIENEVDGLLIDGDSTNNFSDAIVRLLNDVSLRMRLSEKARTKIHKGYSLETMIEKYQRLYLEMMKE